jgi:hypothetical protein
MVWDGGDPTPFMGMWAQSTSLANQSSFLIQSVVVGRRTMEGKGSGRLPGEKSRKKAMKSVGQQIAYR